MDVLDHGLADRGVSAMGMLFQSLIVWMLGGSVLAQVVACGLVLGWVRLRSVPFESRTSIHDAYYVITIGSEVKLYVAVLVAAAVCGALLGMVLFKRYQMPELL